MSEVMPAPCIDAASARPAAPTPVCLSVREVVGHVARTQRGAALGLSTAQLIDTADACVRLGVQRQVLSAGLGTQEALDRLAQIATGRAVAGRLSDGDRDAVVALQHDMRARLSHILADWRQAGQVFTRLTGLLPAQLSGTWPALDSAQRHALERSVPAASRGEFERARQCHRSTHRRQMRATHELERCRETHGQLQLAFEGGQCALVALSRSHRQLQRLIESHLQAEADRLVAQHVMDLLARPVRDTPNV